MDNLDGIIRRIEDHTEMTEVAEITVLRGFMGTREVEIELSDRGSRAGSDRWQVAVRVLDELPVSAISQPYPGNPAATFEEALSNFHWADFKGRNGLLRS